jgi:1-acyl-sn-glycerol-3-phosphate acyltransferase
LGTAFSFGIFGVGGLLIGLVIFPLSSLFLRDRLARQVFARRLIGRAFGTFIEMMSALGVISYEIHGKKNFGTGRNTVIIANHPTLIDVVFLISMFPQSDCVIKEAVMNNPFMRHTVKAANYISSNAPDELLAACEERLVNGGSLILFPEGTRSVQGQPIEFKPGAATIAIRAGSKILPVAIDCQPRLLGKKDPWYTVNSKRPHFTLKVMPPVSCDDFFKSGLNQRDKRRAINDGLLALINREVAKLTS